MSKQVWCTTRVASTLHGVQSPSLAPRCALLSRRPGTPCRRGDGVSAALTTWWLQPARTALGRLHTACRVRPDTWGTHRRSRYRFGRICAISSCGQWAQPQTGVGLRDKSRQGAAGKKSQETCLGHELPRRLQVRPVHLADSLDALLVPLLGLRVEHRRPNAKAHTSHGGQDNGQRV